MNPFELFSKAADGRKQPLDAGTIARAVQGDVRPTVDGADPDTWMSPNQPLRPMAPQAAGRQFDYAVGANLQYTPRGTEGTSFAQLRALADSYDLLRILIETRKDQLVKFEWTVGPIDDEGAVDERALAFQRFLKFPDRRHNWQTWLRALIEDMLVTDAACLYPVMNRGGGLHALELFDGTTLKVVIDDSGRQPEPPGVAFQQVLKGIPAVDYTADDIIYAPRNVRTNRLYGYPPVEQIIMTVNIALRRQLSQLQAYTEGNIPEALATVPASWNVDQIAKYQNYWDSLLEGNTAMRRHLKFIPEGTKYYPTKEEMLKDPFDEWLARICCFCFSVPPSAFVKDMNRATSESAKEAATEEGLVPLMAWVKDLLDLVLWKYLGWEDLEFRWQDEEPTDPVEQAQQDEIYIKLGVKSVDEVRQDLGYEGIGMGNAIYTSAGATLIEDVLNPPEPPVAAPTKTPPAGAAAEPGAEGSPPAGQEPAQKRDGPVVVNVHVRGGAPG